jgi:hypothetical protein
MKQRWVFSCAILLAHCGQAVRPATDSAVASDAAPVDPDACIAGWRVVERAVPIITPGNALVRDVVARRASDADPFVRHVLWVDGPQPVPPRPQQIILSRYDGEGRLDRDDRALFARAGSVAEGSVSVISAEQERGISSAAITEPGCVTVEWSAGLSLSQPRSLSMPPCLALWGLGSARFALVGVRSNSTTLELTTFGQGFDSPPTIEARVELPANEHITNGWASAARQSALYFAYRTPTNAVRAIAFDSPRASAPIDLGASSIVAMAAAADDNAGWFVLAPSAGPLVLVRLDARDNTLRRAPLVTAPNAGLLVSAAVSAIELLVAYFEGEGALRVAVVDLPSMRVRGVLPVSEGGLAFGPKITAVGERDAFIVHNVPNGANGRMAATTLTRCQGR